MNRVVLATLLFLLFSTSSAAEQVVPVSCPGKEQLWLPERQMDNIGALAGKGDFLPIINNSDKLHPKRLYLISGTAHRADYLAAMIWSSSLNRLGVSCLSAIRAIYKKYTGKELEGYYQKAVVKGLKQQ